MPDSRQTDQPKVSAKASLTPASDSADPDVHRLLAERQGAATNLAAVTQSDADKEAAKAYRRQLDDLDAQLADLGVSST